MKLITIENINKEYEILGSVKGSTVQTRNVLRDVIAGVRNVIGGEMVEYSEMLQKAREISESRMIEEAEKLGADAIIGVRYTTSSVMQGCSEILVFGTAIKYI